MTRKVCDILKETTKYNIISSFDRKVRGLLAFKKIKSYND